MSDGSKGDGARAPGVRVPGVRVIRREPLSEHWFSLERVTVEQVTRRGERQVIDREVYHNGPGAAVLPFDPARRTVLLVRQLRVPVLLNGDDPFLIEACAGIVEAGDTPARTAAKEAEQELGTRVRDIRPVFTVYPSPGASAEQLHLFVAAYGAADRTGDGGGLAEEGEDIRVFEMPLDEAWAMVRDGRISDGKTILLLQHLLLEDAACGRAASETVARS